MISRFELRSAATSGRKKDALEALRAALPPFLWIGKGADRAAGIRRTLEEKGAGIVRRHQETPLTRSRKHFERVEGLRLAAVDSRG